MNNPTFEPTTNIYSITLKNQSLDQGYEFDIITTSTGPFIDKDGIT